MVYIHIYDARNDSDTDQYQMSVTSTSNVNRGGEPGAASKELTVNSRPAPAASQRCNLSCILTVESPE